MQRIILLLTAVAASLIFSPSASAQAGVGGLPFVGEILVVPYEFAPNGWAFCDGSVLPISQNEALFNLIGTTYGGDGVSTFALPDLRGRTAVHMGQGPGLSAYVIAQNGGEESVTLSVSQMPAHTHTALGTSSLGSSPSPSGNVWAAQSRLDIYSSAGPFVQMAGGALSSAGNGLPHDNQSPYLVMNYVISLFGIFPSRN
jgi:microcystin-dependent protein